RTVYLPGEASPPQAALAEQFAKIAAGFQMDWALYDGQARPKVVILVSRFDHCLNDLLYRYRTGALPMEIAAIVSNHPDLAELAEWHRLPFHHFPVTPATKGEQEAKILSLIGESGADLVILARYMQILTPEFCEKMPGRIINIHHSFLPGFKGASPYRQAYEHGVKLIGATAHYVTAGLDEGPIIEQAVERVDHSDTIEEFIHVGRDTECQVLAKAVRYHLERRVLLNDKRTVVFR
ncbi:MAG: formyltetrahydrofolate deformylase, partial [Alphaproteobacteria bacterium]|nr:formyltetrahydrofolate deformylase [Alphaproteobacteria bacterium]